MTILSLRAKHSAVTFGLLVGAIVGGAPASAQQRPGPDGLSIAGDMFAGLVSLPGAVLAGTLVGPGHAGSRGSYAADGPDAEPVCTMISRPVYDFSGRFIGYRTFPRC